MKQRAVLAVLLRIAVLRDGLLQQCGAPQVVYDQPDNLFVAKFIGSPAMNQLQGRIERERDTLVFVLGEQRLRVGENALKTALVDYEGREVVVGIRPERLGLAAGSPSDAARLRGRASDCARVCRRGAVRNSDLAVLTARVDTHARVVPGDVVDLSMSMDHVHFFDPKTHRAIR